MRKLSWRFWITCIAMSVALAGFGSAESPVDADRDGISDSREQVLLEQFRPTFMLSATDCAVRPASFKSGQIDPELALHDGTIYGQVFRVAGSDRLEIHYYTLWDRDCGRVKHALDVEHVSVLVTDDDDAKALYWYAGAHENTACDISSGARAEAIDAERKGPRVWVSNGKHAMYLRRSMCGGGCGADLCESETELSNSTPVINVGELEVPLNGSEWTKSGRWMFAEKMDSDFPDTVLARLDASVDDSVVTLRGSRTVRGTIQGSDTVLSAAGTGADHTGAALGTANTHTSKSLGSATRATGRAFKRAWKAVAGRKDAEPTPSPESGK